MSNLSAFPYIPERSQATPGLWNYPLSIISANIAALDSGLTSSSPSGNTFSFLTNIETSGGAHFQFLSVGSTPPSYVTTAAITVKVNSAYSDYLYFADSSAQKSSYVVGSRAGNLADGLNIWDASAGTMIASFSKQSIRFFQNVVGPVFDVGGALASTYNAATFGGSTTTVKIQAAISQASIDSIRRVYIPASMYPYESSQIVFEKGVQMVREGGNWAVYDVAAYGASLNNSHDDTSAYSAAIVGALAQNGSVYQPPGTAIISSPLPAFTAPIFLIGSGDGVAAISYIGSGRTLFTMNGQSGGQVQPGWGLRNIWLFGPSSTGTAVALQLGGATGSFGFTLEDVQIRNWGTALGFADNSSFHFFKNCAFTGNGRNINIPTGLLSFEGLRFYSCAFLNAPNAALFPTNIQINPFVGSMTFTGCSFDDVGINLLGGAGISFVNSHIECTGAFLANAPFINSGADVLISNSLALLDPAAGVSFTEFFTCSGGNTVFVGLTANSNFTLARCIAYSGNASGLVAGFVQDSTTYTQAFVNTGTGSVTGISAGGTGNAISMPTGTALLPSMNFVSETSLGWYRSSASNIALSYGNLNIPVGAANINTLTVGAADGINNYLLADGLRISGDNTLDTIYNASRDISITAASGQSIHLTKVTSPGFGFTQLTATGESLSTGGSAVVPGWGFQSEFSLGIYRSAASTVALSYGTIDLTGGGAMTSIASLKIKSGANNSCGTAVLGSNGSVNVANTYVKTGDLIFLTDQTAGGTLGDLEIGGIRNSSGFTILSTSVTDTSTVAWLIVRPG